MSLLGLEQPQAGAGSEAALGPAGHGWARHRQQEGPAPSAGVAGGFVLAPQTWGRVEGGGGPRGPANLACPGPAGEPMGSKTEACPDVQPPKNSDPEKAAESIPYALTRFEVGGDGFSFGRAEFEGHPGAMPGR